MSDDKNVNSTDGVSTDLFQENDLNLYNNVLSIDLQTEFSIPELLPPTEDIWSKSNLFIDVHVLGFLRFELNPFNLVKQPRNNAE